MYFSLHIHIPLTPSSYLCKTAHLHTINNWLAVIRKPRHSTTTKSFNNKAQAQIWACETKPENDRMAWGDTTLVKDISFGDVIEMVVIDDTLSVPTDGVKAWRSIAPSVCSGYFRKISFRVWPCLLSSKKLGNIFLWQDAYFMNKS